MACFVVSAVGAIGAGVARHIVKHNEKKNPEKKVTKFGNHIPWSKKLAYLELTLWGGSFLLAIEHAIHGEEVFYPPFLTAVQEGQNAVLEMLKEMGTVGVAMFVTLLVALGVGVLVSELIADKKQKAIAQGE